MGLPFTIAEVTWDRQREPLARLRQTVFVEEQSVPEELEWDDQDADAFHVLAKWHDGTPIGCGRMPLAAAYSLSLPPDLADRIGAATPIGKIGRMAVLPDYRRQGVGAALLSTLVNRAKTLGLPLVMLEAQVGALAFYNRYGFTAYGDIYVDAGIDHRKMVRKLR